MQVSTMQLGLVIKLKVIVTVSVETASNPYGSLAEIKAFDLSVDLGTVASHGQQSLL